MPSSAAVAERIDAEAQKLHRYYEGITRCHVVIIAPHAHHRHGRHYAMHLELSVPQARLVISSEPAAHARLAAPRLLTRRREPEAPHKDLYVVVREVFDSARRRLEDYARRRRGDVKRHAPSGAPEPSAD